MITSKQLATGLGGAIGCDYLQARDQLFFVEYDGKISRLDLIRSASTISSGTAVLHGTWLFDLETGTEVDLSQRDKADIWWEQHDNVRRSMVPLGDAEIANIGVVNFDGVSAAELQSLGYSSTPINGNDDATNQLVNGDVFAVITRSGNYTKVQVVNYGYDITIRWMTYELRLAYQVLGTGYTHPEDIVVSADGKSACVTERNGNLLWVNLANADRVHANVISSGMTAPHQIALDETGNQAYVVEYANPGRMLRIDLASGEQTVLYSDLENAIGLVVTDDLRFAYVSEQKGGGNGQLSRIELSTGQRDILVTGMTNPFFLTWADAGEGAILTTERDPSNRVVLIDLTQTPASVSQISTVPVRPSSVAVVEANHLLVCSANEINALNLVSMQFVTQGPDGEMVEQEFTYNSVPAPHIRATIQDWQIDKSGMVTLSISGTVSDRTSGIVSYPNLQVQNITISAGNQPGDVIDLVNSAEPEYPWQPYRFQSSFSTTVQLQTHPVQHEYHIFLETSENAAGVAGQLNLVVFHNGSDIQVVGEAENDPGTYIPTIMRVDAPEGAFTKGEDRIYAFDSEWLLEYRDLGDEEYYWYAMDSQDNVQIFLPALYAKDLAFIKVIEEDLVALVKKNGQTVSFREAVKIYGLIVDNESIYSYLDLSLTNFTEKTYKWGNITKYVYRPRTGWAKNKDNFLETEIKYRYVNHADGISGSFKSKKQFEAMVEIRKKIVKSARDVKGWGKIWKETAFWTKNRTVKSDKTASDAIAHAFDPYHQSKYGMGCWMAAVLVMERGWCLHAAKGFNDVVSLNPFGWKPSKLYSKVITREGRPAAGGSILLKDKVKWIPGDWGYILNQDPKKWEVECTNASCKHRWTVYYGASYTCSKCGSPGQLDGYEQGENIIYLGGPNQGSGKPAIGNFELLDETKFKKSGYFWGHLPPSEKTLQQWFAHVKSFSKITPKILDLRDRIKY